jgi:hypothetical protein
MSETTAVIIPQNAGVMSLKQIGDRVNLVHQVLEKVMRDGTHFGTVPGCGSKKVLLKPGADVLAMTFRLVPQFSVTRTDLGDGHREYDVTCSMYGPDGSLLGQGVGSASTMEKKYRYRKDAKGNQAENPDIADVYNTVLKIAKKRAHIDATLTVTGAADLFTQDLIDEDPEPERKAPPPPTRKAPPPAPTHSVARGSAGAVDAEAVTGVIEAVSTKAGTKKDGTEYTRYGIKIGEMWFNTFSDTVGQVAEACKERGETVTVQFATNARGYHDIIEHGLTVVGEPQAAPVDDSQEPF